MERGRFGRPSEPTCGQAEQQTATRVRVLRLAASRISRLCGQCTRPVPTSSSSWRTCYTGNRRRGECRITPAVFSIRSPAPQRGRISPAMPRATRRLSLPTHPRQRREKARRPCIQGDAVPLPVQVSPDESVSRRAVLWRKARLRGRAALLRDFTAEARRGRIYKTIAGAMRLAAPFFSERTLKRPAALIVKPRLAAVIIRRASAANANHVSTLG